MLQTRSKERMKLCVCVGGREVVFCRHCREEEKERRMRARKTESERKKKKTLFLFSSQQMPDDKQQINIIVIKRQKHFIWNI